MGHRIRKQYVMTVILLYVVTACSSQPPAVGNSITRLGWEGGTFLWVSGDIGGNGLLRMVRYNIADGNATFYERYFDRFLTARDGTVWTIDGGVSRFDGQTWHNYGMDDGLTGGSYRSLLEARDGSIWIGGAGLNYLDTQTNGWRIIVPRLPDKCESADCAEIEPGAVYSLIQAGDGSIWAGTTQGVIRYNGVTTETWTTNDGLGDNSVKALIETRDGTIWAGTDNGISRKEGKTWRSWPNPGDRPVTPGYQAGIENLLETKDGAIWAATSNRLIRWDGTSWHDIESPCNYRLTGLLETPDKSLWVSSNGLGVCRWDSNKWHVYKLDQGLTDNNILTMLVGPNGTLWAGSLHGIIRYDPSIDRWRVFPRMP